MDFLALAQSRRSIRDFTGQDVSPEQVETLLRAAQSAPSGGNCQPWHFYVIRDRQVIGQAVERARASKFIAGAPVLLVVCADPARSEGRYGERGKNLYALQDTAAAVQNILLCAKSLGLGACWCGAFDEAALAALNLPGHLRPVALIPVGYPTTEQCYQVRRPLEEVVTFIGGEDKAPKEPERKPLRFEHMVMSGAVFHDADLSDSSFSNINMAGAAFSDINMTGVTFSDLNLSNARFANNRYDGMTIEGRPVSGWLKQDQKEG